MSDDASLLRRFVAEHSDDAFRELVSQRIDFVYATALRQVGGDTHLAADVTQIVFADLARKARLLANRPNLLGWLYISTRFAAAKSIRARWRRMHHETTAYTMNEPLNTAPRVEVDWAELRPVLDDVLHDLSAGDREAVLLRYFEGRSLASVGEALGLPENSARMRVNRALEKLRLRLIGRGLTSTTAAIATALAQQPSIMAPAGLAHSVACVALAGAPTAGLLGLLSIMSTTKIVGIGAVTVCLVSATFLLSRSGAPAEHPVAPFDNTAKASSQRPPESKSDSDPSAKEIGVSKRLEISQVDVRPTREDLLTRRFRARAMKDAGRFSDALNDYMWLFDLGGQVRQADRRVGLLTEMAALGAHYPPALDALRERIAIAAKLLENSPGDDEALKDLVALNKVLQQEDRTIALYDSLISADPMRKKLAAEIFEPLVNAGRYRDAMSATTYARIARSFDNRSAHDTGSLSWQNLVVQKTLKEIEALAGIGDIEHAAELSNKLLSYSSRDETKEMLRRALARTGQSERIELK